MIKTVRSRSLFDNCLFFACETNVPNFPFSINPLEQPTQFGMSKKRSSGSDHIRILRSRVHNLKDLSVDIPKNKLTVVTGLSGSGKSSLALDTLYAEGQRRYVESLSSYARQFLGRLNKPDCDGIEGLSPAIAIEQKVGSRNPRSTVGTATEIYDYLKLLYARLGRTYSPISGKEVKRHRVSDVIDHLIGLPKEERILILAPIELQRDAQKTLSMLRDQGYARVLLDEEVFQIESIPEAELKNITSSYLVVDRLQSDMEREDNRNRAADSIQTAFFEGHGQCVVRSFDSGKMSSFSDRFEMDGMRFEEPSTHLFSFNNPFGACPVCEGFGSVVGIDRDLVIPNPSLSVYEDCVVPWRGAHMQKWKEQFVLKCSEYDFPIHKAYGELTDAQKELLWKGKGRLKGINAFFDYLEQKSYKIQFRVMLARYRGKTACTTCSGGRLREEASYVRIGGRNIAELNRMALSELSDFMGNLSWDQENETQVAKQLMTEIKDRLTYLIHVGLPYLNLNRSVSTLSGGEAQRVRLATSLGSSLVGSIYVLDEPSIGLHPSDTRQLIGVLEKLRDQGNTVLVVEHDEDIMRSADHLIDIGPEAGFDGGELVFEGPPEAADPKQNFGHTVALLNGAANDLNRSVHRTPTGFITVRGAGENNLKNIDVQIPLGVLSTVTGVSGSGKSSLVRGILYPALKRILLKLGDKPGKHIGLEGDIELLDHVEFVDQNPIGRSSRSNPITYIKAYDDIRNLFASQPLAKQRGYKGKHFSFNVAGGRCDQCEGEGVVTVEMQFMADVKLSCETCHGRRFKNEVLEVKVKEKTIHDVLELTVEEAICFFSDLGKERIVQQLQALLDVGMGYVKLGQSSSTLSGGEAQRIKLALFLLKGKDHGRTLFIFDEPTTGLHFKDIEKLLRSFDALLQKGHSILLVEHQMDLVSASDWLIDLGPEGGEKGGFLNYCGPMDRDAFTAPYSKTQEYLLDQ